MNKKLNSLKEDYKLLVNWWQSLNTIYGNSFAEVFKEYVISFVYNSSKIENTNIFYDDVRKIFSEDSGILYTGDLRTLFEIRNAKVAMEYFFKAFREKMPFDKTFIKELQRRLTLNTYDERRWQRGERPGEYKKGDYVTGRNETGAFAEDVAEEMQELLEDLETLPEEPEKILTAAAFFHAKFENIHPFADGNGRTGRLAMNYLLAIHNHPPLIIHQEDRKAYFEALEAWDIEQNLKPLKTFLLEQLIKTWEKRIEKLEKMVEHNINANPDLPANFVQELLFAKDLPDEPFYSEANLRRLDKAFKDAAKGKFTKHELLDDDK